MSETRYIFITGGVVSSLGKGIATAALGALLQARGYSVRLRKLDPYLNIDPGTMNPSQHGEVFVTTDGAETDLDLGHYERFTGVECHKSDNITAGRIYREIIEKERRGDYLGATVQVIPHVTDRIKAFILNDTENSDFVLCEIGGTIGDIEGLPFFEAIRQLGNTLGRERTAFIHLTLLPFINSAGEMKTKPTQHSVKEMRAIGIQPDVLLCRTERSIPDEERHKIALFCNVYPDAVIEALDVETIYEVPIAYHREGLDRKILACLGISEPPPIHLDKWERALASIYEPDGEVSIAVVGKYMRSTLDSYKSLGEALVHGGMANQVKVNINWLEAEQFEGDEEALSLLESYHGILIPGAFGSRGAEGKIAATHFARTRLVPWFGICFGMQMAVIEAARNLAKIEGASSGEFGNFDAPVVGLMEQWMKEGKISKRANDLGGTMRLGSYSTELVADSKIANIYQRQQISERHRHRYEVNINYREPLEKTGLYFSAFSPDGNLPEAIELKDHPWYIGVQYHPELQSRPFEPHPLFASFIEAAIFRSRLI